MIRSLVKFLTFPLRLGKFKDKKQKIPLESLIIEGQEVFDTEGEPLMLKVGKRKFNDL